MVDSVLAGVTPRTKLALLDHITSSTGLVFPLADLVQQLARQEIDVLVDGAHAPGMVPLNLEAIGAAYYTGNCHKWLCAPKGAAFLYVRPDRQDIIRPLTVSHGANSPRTDRSRFLLEFDWMGTDDPTAFLSVPVALDVIGSLLPGGWPEVMARNRQLAIAARQRLCEAIAVELPAPASMLGSLAAIPLPQGFPADLQPQLYQRLGIQVPVFDWNGQRILRISAQLYNSLDRYDKLAHALQQLRQENVEQID